MKKIHETYTFVHKKIEVDVSIHYLDNKISLIDARDQLDHKKWVFANRGVEYMNGWLTILEAMSMAVKDAKKRYEAELAEQSAFRGKVVVVVKRKKR